jgi:hypothetical protein
MDALGVRHLFTQPNFGGFSTDYCNPENVRQSWKDRAEFVRIAARKLQQQQPGRLRRGLAAVSTLKSAPSQGLACFSDWSCQYGLLIFLFFSLSVCLKQDGK